MTLKRLAAFFLCWDLLPLVFVHGKVRVVHEFGSARKLRCDRCGRYFAMSDQHQAVLRWDEDFEQLYCDMLQIKRTLR